MEDEESRFSNNSKPDFANNIHGNGHTEYLRDGRARNLTEAIMWHSGEAQNSKEAFRNPTTKGRNDLLKFLNSL